MSAKPIPPGSAPGAGAGNGAAGTPETVSFGPPEVVPAAQPATPAGGDTKVAEPATKPSGETEDQDRTPAGSTAADTKPEDDDLGEFVTPDDRKTFGEAINKLDPASRKAMRKLLDAKFKEAASARQFLESWATPETARETILKIAPQLGLQVADPKRAVTEDAKTKAIAAVRAELGAAVGEDAATRILTSLQPLLSTVAEEAVRPLREEADIRLAAEAQADAQEALADFQKAHPDWKEHEPAMIALGRKLKIEPNSMTPREYTEMLYNNVTLKTQRERMEAEITKEVTKRLTAGAAGAGQSSEKAGVSETRVVPAASGPITFEEAVRRAKAGLPPP